MMENEIKTPEQAVAAERQLKVDAILREITKNEKFVRMEQGNQRQEPILYQFKGQIGADIDFTREHRVFNAKASTTDVNLMYKGEPFWKIMTNNSVTRDGANEVDMTQTMVAAPLGGKTGITTQTQEINKTQKLGLDGLKTVEKIQTLDVRHTPDETPDEVLDQILDTMSVSKDKAVIAKKLSKLNLPSKVQLKNRTIEMLAECAVVRIHGAMNQDNDREM